MITKEGLKAVLISEINSRYANNPNPEIASLFYLQVIKDYIEANAVVTYAYTGTLTTSPPGPDPLSGIITAKVQCPVLTSAATVRAFVMGRTQADPSGFVAAIMQDSLGTVVLDSPCAGETVTIYTPVSVNPSISQVDNYQDAWDIICDAIIQSFLSLTTAPISTVTTSPGSGVSTFLAIT